MKTITQLTALLTLALIMNACAINDFSRQRYTNFSHAKNLHLKEKKQTSLANQTSEEEINQVAATSIANNTSILPDSVVKEQLLLEEKTIAIPTNAVRMIHHQNRDSAKQSVRNRVGVISKQSGYKIKDLHSAKRAKQAVYKKSDEKTEEEKIAAFRKTLKILLIIAGSAFVLTLIFLIVGAIFSDLLVYMAIAFSLLSILSMIGAMMLVVGYKLQHKEASIWDRHISESRLAELDKQSKTFSLISYLMSVPLGISIGLLAVSMGSMVFILVIAALILALITFLTLAVIKGKQYKQSCEALNVQPTKRTINRYKFNSVLLALMSLVGFFWPVVLFLVWIA